MDPQSIEGRVSEDGQIEAKLVDEENSSAAEVLETTAEDEAEDQPEAEGGSREEAEKEDESQRSSRKKRSIFDVPVFDCPQGYARDPWGRCRPLY